VTIDPAWFQEAAPGNPLLDEDRPWVEVAGTSQADLLHPPVRMAVEKSIAAFWYNPYQGVVRARVPVMVSDDKATELYNRVNGTGMSSIFVREGSGDAHKSKSATTPASSEAKAAGVVEEVSKVKEQPVATFTIMKGERKHSKR